MHGLPSRSRVPMPGLIIAVTALLLLFATAWYLLAKLSRSFDETGAVIHLVERGDFIHEIIERGSVESGNNVEIKCKVKGLGRGTRILWVIPEGTQVEPAPDWEPDPDNPDEDPPDLLVKLDSSSLEDQKIREQISCNTWEAKVIEANKDLETARITLEAYVENTYERDKQSLESEIFVAQELCSRARRLVGYREELLAKGYITAAMVQRDRFDVEKARMDWDGVCTELSVLENHTKHKFVKARQSDIEISVARVEAEEKIYEIMTEKLASIIEQIDNCTIRAPQAGQVVYANQQSRHGQEVVIEEGAVVREHQVLIRLPDPTAMRVKSKIDESAIAMVQEGMPVRINLDAFDDLELSGSVQKVNEYPEPSSWMSTAMKEYETIIGIDDLASGGADGPTNLRPGMTAEVKIRVRTLPDVIQVPVQAVFEHAGKHYCVQPGDQGFSPRQVTIGPTNDETVVIAKGLQAGEQVVMAAASYRDQVGLPQLQPEAQGHSITHLVERGEFIREITERGSVESANNVEIKCQVEGLGGGTMILWVIPEGTRVEPVPDWKPDPDNPGQDPPDLLVKLDASALENQETQQETWCKTANAVVIRAESDLEMARIELEEYVEGKYEQEKQRLENLIVVAHDNYGRAQQDLEFDQGLLTQGFVTMLTVEAGRFAVEKTKKDWQARQVGLRVLEDYTKPKTEKSMQANIKTSTAKLDSEQKKYQLNLRKLALIKEQIEKCTIRAPEAGQVVYANQQRESGQIIIEEGTVVRQHQVLIRLPDPTTMQVKAKINESKVALVQEGMPAKIRLDAFEGVELTGTVEKINEYPEATSFGASVQEYETTVRIDDLPKDKDGRSLDLRPGMTAQVTTRVQTLPNVIQVPVQAVLEHNGKYYCVRPNGESFKFRPVTVGSANQKNVVILKGLDVGEQVLTAAASYRDQLVDLLQFRPETSGDLSQTPKQQPSVARKPSPLDQGAQGEDASAHPTPPPTPPQRPEKLDKNQSGEASG